MREMKDSGIEWIGKIPRHWEIVKNKYFAQFINGYAFDSKSLKNSFNVPVIRIGDITDKDIDYKNCLGIKTNSIGLRKYRIKDKDIVIAMSGATVGKTCIASNPPLAFINQRVGIVRTHSPRFLHYCLSTKEFVAYILLNSNGSAQPNFSSEIFKNYFIPNPSEDEQQVITDFLDSKCADIDSLTVDIQKQINILKEYKKSVITQAVTKGLDPNVEMKDSGVGWIGKLPKSWRIFRLKYLLAKPLQYGASEIGIEFTKDLPRYIRITDVDENNHLKEKGKLSLSFEKAKPYILKDNCVLFARSGATVGKTFFYKRSYGLAAFAGYLIAAVTKPSLLCVNWLYYYTQSNTYWNWVKQIFNQSTIQNIGADKYNNLPITVPTLKEQQAIADFLDAKCADIDAVITGKQKQLDILKEYKKSLIYEYVTGKKEVPCHE